MPVRDGGAFYDLDNVQALRRECHFRKTARENRARFRPPTADEVGWNRLVAEVLDS